MGKILIIAGVILIVVGVLVSLSDRIPFFGKLPGDFSFESDKFKFYFPLTSSIIISIIVSVILYFVNRMRQ